jgi:[glutamine synthetase] adenylyltransferase / [glutamine synthetase]-adenylyl-L-tyrosine phosphorylase
MSFASRLTRVPRVHNATRADDALAELKDLPDGLGDLVRGAAGSSPYLADLIRRESDWLPEALDGDAEPACENVLKWIETSPDATLPTDLRCAKRRIALLVALADLGGVWTLEEVTGALTRFSDLATERALRAAIAAEIRRGKLPGQTEDDLAVAGGLSVIAMGKMGAFELNYSSDIDLICLFDETRFDPDDYADARASFVRAVRRMCLTLGERTAEGYVFRTDLRLRPDASVTPVAMSMEAAERYYESFGRTWERAAYIKARPAAGDQAAGARFLDTLRPFVWRRHLDFAAIQDAHDMRLRIREHKGLHRAPSHLGHDMKLGQGGIREIEFFTQTRQIIAGGRDPDLRVAGTVSGLARLAEKGWVGAEDAETLTADYRAHREVEHRIQMIDDQQTHDLPATEQEFARLAALAGRDAGDYAEEIETRLARVAKLTEGFFAPGQETKPVPELSEKGREIVARWPGYPALRSPRAVEIFKRMRPQLLARLEKTARPEEALVHIDGFLAGLPAGVQLFSLFEANPQLLDLVVDVVDTAPALGQYLARNAGVFDAVIGGAFFADWPGARSLQQALTAVLAEETDYEKQLDRARVWAREWHFRVGVHFLRGLIDAETAGRQYAELADAAVASIWPVVVANFAEKHGPPPGRGAVVVAMGSLGAGRLNAASDLDLIVIYDGSDAEASEGRRSLATRPYYARLTQALVTALSAPTAEGRLYEVDMRLRPSGRQGPVATALSSFKRYQTEEAWTWEHLALTRARPLAGDGAVGDDVESFRQELLGRPRDRSAILADVAAMRARLAEARPANDALDVKTGPGRLQDIELYAEAGALLAGNPKRRIGQQLTAAAEVFHLSDADRQMVKSVADLYWRVQASARLVAGIGSLDAASAGAGASAFLIRETGAASLQDLEQRLAESARSVQTLIDKMIGTAPGSD